jgi:hypothetical protein
MQKVSRMDAELAYEWNCRLDHMKGPWFTYFLTDGQAIKIGKAKGVLERVATLQTGNPSTLTLLALMDGDYERKLHRQFSDYSITGEWFEINGELLRWITTFAVSDHYALSEVCDQQAVKANARLPSVSTCLEEVGEADRRETVLFRTMGQPRSGLTGVSEVSLTYGP